MSSEHSAYPYGSESHDGASNFRSVDLESQSFLDTTTAEFERQMFDEVTTSRKGLQLQADDDDRGKSSSQKKRKMISSKSGAERDGDKSEGKRPKKAASVEDGDCGSAEQKTRKQHSKVWEDFRVITKFNRLNEPVEKAVCNHCKKEYAHDSHKNGTSALIRHRDSCVMKARNGDVGKMMINAEAKLQARKYDHSIFRVLVAKSLIQHDLPYAYVEYERVRAVWRYLNADVKFFSRHTAQADVYKFYESEMTKLKRELAHLPGRICFTTDLWTAISHQGYLCLTAHYVDVNWKLQNKIIAFCDFPPPHTGMHLAMKILDLFKEWGVEKKVFSITVDNATSNDSMQEILKSQLVLRDDLLCGGEFYHVRCSAHILNLIVQDSLKVIKDSLTKIRESIKFVQSSEAREILFQNSVETVGIDKKAGLVLDVTTRWNSTYKMLERAIYYKAAFANLKIIEGRNYKSLPSEDEWAVGKMICDLLQPFDEITRLISGSTYPTSNLYFMQIWKIQMWLRDHAAHDNEVIRDMVRVMQEKFDKYWEEYNDVLAMATVFDPRLKMTLAEYCYGLLDKTTAQDRLKHMREKLSTLFEPYNSKFKKQSPSSETRETVFEKSSDGREDLRGSFPNYNDFLAFRKSNVAVSGKLSLDVYLDEPPLDMTSFESLDILKYWKDNSGRFKDLAAMACDVLSIPITTVASESSFSIGSRVLNKYRSCLLPKNVQALICTRNWLKGFEAYDNEENEKFEGEDEKLPSFQASRDGDDDE